MQTQLGQYATSVLNAEFGTDISIERIAITPFGSVKLRGVLVRDHHQDTLFHIQSLQTSLLNVSKLYNEGHPYLGDAIFHGLDVHIHQFKGENYTNLDKFIEAFDDGSPSSGKFRMKIASMTIFNSRFRYTDENLETPKMLDFKKLEGKLDDFFIKGPNVYTFIEKLAFKDHRGLQMEQLTANFTYTKSNISLKNLEANTSESEIKGNVALRYKREDFSDFNNKVIFDVNFKKAVIASNDLNYFYNEFGKNNLFYVNTHLIGTLNNFTTENLKLVDKNQSEIIGNLTFKNLFHKEKSFYIDGKLYRVSSNYENLSAILPNILGKRLPASLAKLGNVTISGTIQLTEDFINSKVNVLSNLGEVTADLAIQDLSNIDNATYQGEIALNQFEIGTLLGQNEIGWTNLNLEVDGQGFNQKYLNTKVKGSINNFVYNNYNYSNITVDGVMKMPYFKGYFNSNDPNLRMDFDGLVDLSSKIKNYNFKAQIDYADLQELNWVKTDTFSIFKGNIVLDAKGNSLDDINGFLNFNNVSYQNSKASYFFEDFAVTSSFDENKVRTITVDSKDIVNGKIVGKYKFAEVQKIVENAVGSLYANYSPNKLREGQYLNFNFEIHNKIVEVFIPEIVISKNTKVKGKINADEGRFEFDFKSPKIEAFTTTFDNVSIDINNKNPLYNAYIEMDSVKLKNYKISDFSLINVTMNDSLFFRTEFNGGSKNQDQFALNLYHTINEDKKSVVGFKKSEVNLKDYLWFINENDTKDNKIVFDKSLQNFIFENLSLSHNNQNMNFYGAMKDSTYKDLNLVFKDVDLEKITPSLESINFKGKLNGFVSVQQENQQFKPQSSITIDALQVNEIAIGDFIFNVKGNDAFNQFAINSYIKNEDEERFSLEGILAYKNKLSNLDLEAGFKDFDLAPFGSLLSGIVADVRGSATGRATIDGSLSNPEVNGRLYLNNSGLKIPYLNTDYNFEPNAIIDLTERQFLFRNIKITDSKFNTNGILRGSIRHEVFDKWEIDLELRSSNILALDTKDGEDVYYYGTAFLNGFATVKGPTNALVINVVGESEKGTSIKIPVNDSEEIGDNSFINFITREQKFNKENGIVTNINNYQGIELDFDFDINTNADIEVILDRNSGHSMKGNGYGSMKMEINTLGKFLMYGDFQIMEGSYSFKYGGLIDKKFNVKRGGTIRWYGEPMNAVLDLEAIYSTQANPALLLESASFNRKVDTNVSILIQGYLSNPQPDFAIDFPNVSSVLKSEIDYKLQDKDTRQTQALALLSTGSFMTAENVGNVAYGPLFERASSLFSDLFSDEDSKLQLGVDYSQGDRINQISDRVGVTLNTQINDKISINGRVGVPVGGVAESVLIGNVEIQMQLNEDGSLRARVFNRENDINYIGEGIGYTQGIGLTYNVDFDTFKELIQKIFTKKKEDKNKSNNTDDFPDSDLSPDFINFINERKNKKSEPSKEPEEEKEKVPEMD